MSKTVSFVARDELAEWLEQRADERMKSISAVCQDIVAQEYRRQQEAKPDKAGQSGDDGVDSLSDDTLFEFETKREANAARTQFEEYLSEDDDRRLKDVVFAEGTPGDVVEELNRRSKSEI